MTVKLIWKTPDAEKLLAYIARASNPDNQSNPKYKGLMGYMADNKHWSPFEMVNMCVEINTTRDIARQILRHRSFSFQEFCVAEGTLITTQIENGDTKKVPIEKLYAYQNDHRMDAIWRRGIRVYDESTNTFVRSTIKEVFDTGKKECYKVTLEDGKEITCTEDHKFFTREGFSRLSDIKVGDFVAVNGQEVYKSIEVDHKLPVWSHPELAFDISNLQLLCKPCHRQKSTREAVESKLTIRWKAVKSIEYAGVKQTYDLEVDHDSHNYIANGIVTHNSQRYQTVDKLGDMVYRECRLQDTKNRQNSLPCEDENQKLWWKYGQDALWDVAIEFYEKAIDSGVAKEVARALLPEGLTPSRMYVNGNLRSWIHYVQVRTDPTTQKEHRLIAEEVKQLMIREFPVISEVLEWSDE